MMREKAKRTHRTCLGTGLITLDLVTSEDKDRGPCAWAGGSCGNVLTILAYLGWKSFPVARLGDDAAAKTVLNDTTKYGVNYRYSLFDKSVHTPIILQRILVTRNGCPAHRFYWVCPNCGNWLPRYTPIRLQDIRDICDRTPHVDCFYFDRISPAALQLAEMARKQGALVVLEPTSIKDDPQFKKAINLCDILKYSNERSKYSPQLAYESQARLVVETLGAEGLRYRLLKNGKRGKWKLLQAFRVRNLVDAAGAGDWCTAGMVDRFMESGTIFGGISEAQIVGALRYGQALSAVNCGFEGARGAMHGLASSLLRKKIQAILDLEEDCVPVADAPVVNAKNKVVCVCPACHGNIKT